MSGFTKQAIMQTFQDMLEVKPFDKITVSSIVKACGISHNTFYYHYRDIYDLLDAWLQEQLGQYTQNRQDSLRPCVKSLLQTCKDHKNMVYHVFNALSRDTLERYIFTSSNDIIFQYVCQQAAGRRVPPGRLTDIANFCLYAVGGYFLKFLWNNMNDDIDAVTDTLCGLCDGLIRQAIEDFPEE